MLLGVFVSRMTVLYMKITSYDDADIYYIYNIFSGALYCMLWYLEMPTLLMAKAVNIHYN